MTDRLTLCFIRSASWSSLRTAWQCLASQWSPPRDAKVWATKCRTERHCTQCTNEYGLSDVWSRKDKRTKLGGDCDAFCFQIIFRFPPSRPLVEYASPVWSPVSHAQIEKLEKVQRRFTKRLSGLSKMTYAARLQYLELQSLERRRLNQDLIMC